jgi:hypothetical protein
MIEAARAHADDDVAAGQLRIGCLLVLQDVRIAVLVKPDRFHRVLRLNAIPD